MRSVSFDESVRYAYWAEHIAVETQVLIGALGSPPDFDRFDDPLIGRGVERSFEVISEAVVRFHRARIDLSDLEPTIDWKGWRAFGNRIRHEYDRLDAQVIQHTLVYEIAPLRLAALRLKARFEVEASG